MREAFSILTLNGGGDYQHKKMEKERLGRTLAYESLIFSMGKMTLKLIFPCYAWEQEEKFWLLSFVPFLQTPRSR